MGSYSALTTLTNTITTMFRAICFAAVIATCLSQNFRNFNKDSRFFPRPVSKSLLSITNILSKFPIGQFASTDNANENDSIFQIQDFLQNQDSKFSSKPVSRSFLPSSNILPNNPIGFRGFLSSNNNNVKDNIFEETSVQANSLKATLRKLANNPKASRYMQRVFLTGDCVQSVEEAFDAIENGVSIIEGAKPELRRLLSTVKRIDDDSDILQVTKTSAEILRQMESLIPWLAPSNENFCGSTFEVTYETLKTVGNILYEVSEDRSLGLSKVTKLELKISKEIVDSMTNFLGELKDTFADLRNHCTSHKGYNVRSMQAIGSMLHALADLFKNLGDNEGEREIREKTSLTLKIAGAIRNFPKSDVGNLNCNSLGDFEATARMLEDLSELIEEVGIENLKSQLGVNGLF